MDYTDQPLAAVSRTVSRLLQDQIILEIPMGDDTGPRRKRALCLNPQLGHCLSIHYGPDEIGAAVINTAYELILQKQESISLKYMSRQERIRTIIDFIHRCRSEIPASAGTCLALGAVDPGMIDETSGVALMSTLLSDWTDVPIVEVLESEFKVPVLLLSTSIAIIRAVDRFELNNAFQNVLYIEYQNGIACGIKLQGNYITGRSHLAGEFGHMKVTDSLIPCRCGAIGCLEAVAALPALAKKYQDILHELPCEQPQAIDKIEGLEVLNAANRGDRLARRIVDDAFTYLGAGVGGLVNLLAPEMVVFDHRISLAGTQAVDILLQSARKNMLIAHIPKTDFRICRIQGNIASLGGAVTLLDTIISY
jgi:predicted NBD/HSP70 family sugar kinase